MKANNKVLALQKLSGLTIRKVIQTREHWFDVSSELNSKRNWLNDLENPKEEDPIMKEGGKPATKKEIASMIKSVKQEVEKLELKLSKTVYLPMIIELRKENEQSLLATLQLMVINVIEFYHTTEVMNADQIHETAFLIMSNFPGLTLEDIALAFHMIKSGELGGIYNRVDGPFFLEKLHKYQDRMQSVGMELQLQRHVQGKGSTWKSDAGYRISSIQEEKFLPTTPVKKINEI